MISWLGGRSIFEKRKNRITVSVAGIAPDIDGVGLLIDTGLRIFNMQTNYWGAWHHNLHSLPFCIVVSIVAAAFVKGQRVLTFVVAFILFNLHVFCDLIGSKGPDGFQWPIPYFYPFQSEILFSWSGQWELNAWQNILISAASILAIWFLIKSKETTPLEVFSKKLDEVLKKIVVDGNA